MTALLAHSRSAFSEGLRPRVRIDIRLDGHYSQSVATYSTLDEIRGEAVVVAEVDTPFDQVAISFTGKYTI